MAQRHLPRTEPVEPPQRPRLADQPSRFVLLECEVELEYRPQMLETLQRKVNTVAEEAHTTVPECPQCGGPMTYHDARPVSWLAHWGQLQVSPVRYRCARCKQERRPLLDLLGVEPGRNLRLFGSSVGTAGRRGSLRTGVTVGPVGPGGHDQRHGDRKSV